MVLENAGVSAPSDVVQGAVDRLQPLFHASALAWWDANVDATEEHEQRRVAAELALSDALADAELFDDVSAARTNDADGTVGRELDEVEDLLVLELIATDQPEPNRGCGDALLEVVPVEAEAVAEELDDVVVPRRVVRLGHPGRIARDYAALVNPRAVIVSMLACAVLVVGGKYFFDLSWESALVLAPVFVLTLGGIAFIVVLWAKVIREAGIKLE